MEAEEKSQGIWWVKLLRLTMRWGLELSLLILAAFWILLVGSTWARAEDIAGGPTEGVSKESERSPASYSSRESHDSRDSKEDDEYNFNWLDPDKKIYVLQNRKYQKAGHAVLSVTAGFGFSNPYKSTYNIDPRLAFYATEAWGVEVFYTATMNTSNSVLTALSTAAPNTLPLIRQIQAQMGVLIHYVPWYAKINVFNTVLYFDWYFAGGVGSVQSFVDTRTMASQASNFVEQDLLGIFFSTGHAYHISQSLLFRLDVTTSFYNAPINGLTGVTSWYSNINFGVGLGLKL